MVEWLVNTLTEFVVGGVVFTVVMPIVLTMLWWCTRQYFRGIRKGYRPASVQVILGVVAIGGPVAAAVLLIMAGVDRWPRAVGNVLIVVIVFLLPPLMVTVASAVLPSRNARRAGPRATDFLFSRTWHSLELVLYVGGAAIIVGGLTAFWWSAQYAIRLLSIGPQILAIPVLFAYWRRRAQVPTLDEALANDRRASVLYLRPFEQDGKAFHWVRKDEVGLYSSRPTSQTLLWLWPVTFEQYLGAAFEATIGSLVALGNPIDVLPPEGAARRYVEDDSWQDYFLAVARAAAALVIEPGMSKNLAWELVTIRRNGWQRKLFFVLPPQQQTRRLRDRWLIAFFTSARGVSETGWSETAQQLERFGYKTANLRPLAPGSIVSFDAHGCATTIAQGAMQPEDYVAAVQAGLLTLDGHD